MNNIVFLIKIILRRKVLWYCSALEFSVIVGKSSNVMEGFPFLILFGVKGFSQPPPSKELVVSNCRTKGHMAKHLLKVG